MDNETKYFINKLKLECNYIDIDEVSLTNKFIGDSAKIYFENYSIRSRPTYTGLTNAEKCRKYKLKNKEKLKPYHKKYNELHKDRIKLWARNNRHNVNKSSMKYYYKISSMMSDSYIALLIAKGTTLKASDVINDKEFISLYRESLRLKRIIHNY